MHLFAAIWSSSWNVEELCELRYVFVAVVLLTGGFGSCLVIDDGLTIGADDFEQDSEGVEFGSA